MPRAPLFRHAFPGCVFPSFSVGRREPGDIRDGASPLAKNRDRSRGFNESSWETFHQSS